MPPAFVPGILVSLAAFFAGLGSYALLDNNEGLYGQIALHMMQTSDYVLPHLNGVVYIEKPPMLYWLTALNYRCFGVNEYSVRLAPALSALIIGLALAGFMRRRAGIMAGALTLLVWASSAGVIMFARVLFFDMLMTLWVTLALLCFYIRLQGGGRMTLYGAYALLAAAVLTKGLLGLVIPGLVLAVFLYFRSNNWQWLPKRGLFIAFLKSIPVILSPVGIIIFLALTIPWHVMAALADPGFLWFYFINEHVLRFLGKRMPMDYYSGPVWYYIPRFAFYLFPWILLVPLRWLGKNSPPVYQTVPADKNLRPFLWIWLLSVFIFFSISKAKANYYIVLAAPPAAALLGLELRRLRARLLKTGVITWLVTILAGMALVAYSAVAASATLFPEAISAFIMPLRHLQTAILILLSCSGALFLAWRKRVRTSLFAASLLLAGLTAAFAVTGVGLMHRYEVEFSTRPAFIDLAAQELPVRQVYLYRGFEELSTAPFYLGKPVGMVDGNCDDLEYGMKKLGMVIPDFISMAELKATQGEPRWILMRKKRLSRFMNEYGMNDFRVWKDYGRIILLSNHPEKSK